MRIIIMKKKVSLKLFLTVLWRGICQVFQFVARLFGYKGKGTFAKVIWGVFASCMTIVVSIFTIAFLCFFVEDVVYEDWIQPHTADARVWDSKHISNYIVFQDIYGADKGRIFNESTQEIILKDVDWVVTSDDKDSLAVFARDDRRGYLNRFTGEVVIPLTYSRAWVFSEGLAAVEKDGELLFINHKGEVVIDKDFQVCFSEPAYAFKGGHCVVRDAVTGKAGLINTNGGWALSPEYDCISNYEGFWEVMKDQRYGLYTADGKEMFPVTNTAIRMYEKGIIEVRMADNTAKRYDYDGNVLVDFVIDDIDNLQYETTSLRNDLTPSEDYSVDKKVYAIATCQVYQVCGGYGFSDHYGLIDRNGKRITEPLYTSIEAIERDLYLCQPDGIIINSQGEIVE